MTSDMYSARAAAVLPSLAAYAEQIKQKESRDLRILSEILTMLIMLRMKWDTSLEATIHLMQRQVHAAEETAHHRRLMSRAVQAPLWVMQEFAQQTICSHTVILIFTRRAL